MSFHKSISHRLLFAAIVIGLNALCFLGVTHGRHVTRHTRIDYSHIPAHAGRGSRNGRSGLIAAADSQTGHVVAAHLSRAQSQNNNSGASAATVLPGVAATLSRPEEQIELLLVRENVLALGSAPRAPGLGRAPPVA